MAGAARRRQDRDGYKPPAFRSETSKRLKARRETLELPGPRPETSDVPDVSVSPASVRVWNTNSKVLPSGILGTKVSELDKTTSMFSQAVLVEHDEAFTLKPLILNEGPLAGRRVLVLVKNVSFLDLPGEVRNQIWDMALERDITFLIGSPDRLHFGDTKNCLSPTTTALTHTNKRVRAEILPIVYGANTFEFTTLARFATFARRMGDSVSYLRKVGIINRHAFPIPSCLPDPWGFLRSLPSLQSLTFNPASVLMNVPVEDGKIRLTDLFDHLKPFLHAWYQGNKGQRGAVRVSELIKFPKQRDLCLDCFFGGRNFQCGDCIRLSRQNMEISERLSEMIVKEFGLKR